jgi:Clp amino terminal domain, pathogenicity island component
MMTLDEAVLAEAREGRQRLVDLESQTAHARVDYHHAIKKLHAAGGSLREIAEALELSHQRVHQIVEGPAGVPGPPPWAGRRLGRGRHRGGLRRLFLDDDARDVMSRAQKEAESLRHGYIGTEHLLLALLRRGTGRLDLGADAVREEIVKRVGEGDQPWIAGTSPRAKRVLAHALHEATVAGRERVTAEDILLAVAEDQRGTGGEVLRELGVKPEQLREQLGR